MRGITLVVLCSFVAPALAAGAADAQGMDKVPIQSSGSKRMLQNDSDGDGKLSAAEWASAGQGRGKEGARERVFARFDANKDGYLDKAEIDSMLAHRQARMDAKAKAGAKSADDGK